MHRVAIHHVQSNSEHVAVPNVYADAELDDHAERHAFANLIADHVVKSDRHAKFLWQPISEPNGDSHCDCFGHVDVICDANSEPDSNTDTVAEQHGDAFSVSDSEPGAILEPVTVAEFFCDAEWCIDVISYAELELIAEPVPVLYA